MTDLEAFRACVNQTIHRLEPLVEGKARVTADFLVVALLDSVAQLKPLSIRLGLPELIRFEKDPDGIKRICVVKPRTACDYLRGEDLSDWADEIDEDVQDSSEIVQWRCYALTDETAENIAWEIISLIHPWKMYAPLVEVGAFNPDSNAPTHSPDFTSVDWYGNRYTFAKGNQARAVKALWEAWEAGEHSLTQETIGQQIGSSANRFELPKVFRRRKRKGKGYEPHPAWGTMIQQDGKGCYSLVTPPSSQFLA